MPRVFVFVLGLLLPVLIDVSLASAQAPAPTWPDWIVTGQPTPFNPPHFPRGVGFYFSIPKIVLSYLMLLLWVATTDWINRDALKLKLPYRKWNTIAYASFAATFLLVWVIPWFWLSFLLLIVAYAAPLYLYVRVRNQGRHEADRVFTKDHLQHLAYGLLSRVGVKPPKGKGEKEGAAVPVTLTPRGAPTQQDEQVRLIGARQSPGFVPARNLIHKAFQNRAAGIMLDYTQEAATVKFLIDGVWLDAETQPRVYADPLLASLKLLCGLKAEERRARQQGSFLAIDDTTKAKSPGKLTSQGTKTGERVLVQFEDATVRKRRLPEMGLRQKLLEDIQAVMAKTKGLVVLGAPPQNGLTGLTTACLAQIDRFTRTVIALEDVRNKDVEVENVQVSTYDSLEQETPQSKLPTVIRQFPDVLVVPDYTDAESLATLCEEAQGERLVVTTVRARDSVEALLRPLLTKIPPKKYALAVEAVVVQRLIRKLCDKCKEAYPPPPQILQRLGLTPDKVPAFYRPPTPRPDRQEICPECNGLGYRGVTGLVELLQVTDLVRATLVKEPTLESLRAAARKGGLKTMEDEGLLLVVKGVTSVPELARVLKEGAAAAAPTA
jgi:type II secretory ATPase GspE/PulE/Tfp pilus assembly ATPase PilB-like protein